MTLGQCRCPAQPARSYRFRGCSAAPPPARRSCTAPASWIAVAPAAARTWQEANEQTAGADEPADGEAARRAPASGTTASGAQPFARRSRAAHAPCLAALARRSGAAHERRPSAAPDRRAARAATRAARERNAPHLRLCYRRVPPHHQVRQFRRSARPPPAKAVEQPEPLRSRMREPYASSGAMESTLKR